MFLADRNANSRVDVAMLTTILQTLASVVAVFHVHLFIAALMRFFVQCYIPSKGEFAKFDRTNLSLD